MSEHAPSSANPIPATPPSRTLLSWSDVTIATDDLIASAQRTIDVFDQSLALQGWDTRARHDALRTAMIERRVQIRILLVDLRQVSSAMPRIMNLLKSHSHQMAILGTESASIPGSNFIVADRQQLIFRPNSVQSTGSLDFSNPYKSNTCVETFEVLWQQGGQRVFPEAFGL